MNSGVIGRYDEPGRYEIRIEGRLGPAWSSWLDGMAITSHSDGTTVVAGHVADQAALHGLLARLRDLGLPLISVARIEDDSGGTRPNTHNPTGD